MNVSPLSSASAPIRRCRTVTAVSAVRDGRTGTAAAVVLAALVLLLSCAVASVLVSADAPLTFPYVLGSTGKEWVEAIAVHPISGAVFFGGPSHSASAFVSAGFGGINKGGAFIVHTKASGEPIWAQSISWATAANGAFIKGIDVYASDRTPVEEQFIVLCGQSTYKQLPATYAPTVSHSGYYMGFLQKYALDGTQPPAAVTADPSER